MNIVAIQKQYRNNFCIPRASRKKERNNKNSSNNNNNRNNFFDSLSREENY